MENDKNRVNIINESIDSRYLRSSSVLIIGMDSEGGVSESVNKLQGKDILLDKYVNIDKDCATGRCYVHSMGNYRTVYIILKYGNIGEMYEAIGETGAKIKEGKFEKRHFYMEKLALDDKDFAKRILEDIGVKVDYYMNKEHDEKCMMVFPLNFKRRDLLDFCNGRIIGQEEANKKLIYYIMDQVESAAYGSEKHAASIMLVGPSGSGKGELVKVINEFLKMHNVPVTVVRIDMSQLTETGFRGRNVESIIQTICDESGGNCDGRAICFIDEADKKLVPSYDKFGHDVNLAVQGNIQLMLEGNTYDIEDNNCKFDSSKTMFVFMGSYQGVRNKKLEKMQHLDFEESNDEIDEIFFEDVTFDDMRNAGMSDEFIGRIGAVVNYNKVSEESMEKIIFQKAEYTGKKYGVKIELTSEAIKEFKEIAFGKTGIREVIKCMEEMVIENIIDMYFDDKSYEGRKLIISGDNEAAM